jgi:dienelactone hydrolase
MNRLFLLFSLCCSLSATAQTIHISPAGPILAGDPIDIKLTGLPPNAKVTIEAKRLIADTPGKAVYRAEATFAADANGHLDLGQAKPLSGTYRNADIHGLFWSMVPSKDSADAPADMNQVLLTAKLADKAIASAQLRFVDTLPAVKTEEVPNFPGAVFASVPGKQRLPAVIVLGGSEGGAKGVRAMSLNLAARGFAVLALPYYSPASWNNPERELPSLPRSFVDIPVDRLHQAHAWLKGRADVDAARIALYGTSKGAEFALLAASKMDWIRSVVAIVPSDVVWQGWGPDVVPADARRSSFSYAGKALPFVPNKDFVQEMSGFQSGSEVRYRRPYDKGRAADPAAAVAARIHVENFKGPLFVAGGIDDQMWASGMMAQNIAERRAEAQLETVALIYTDAGHALNGSGWSPTSQYNAGLFKVGGTAEANATAQAEVWRETLVFLRRTLGLKTGS